MRPGLQLKISQQLTMTPQLQQAIKLLQLSTIELHQEIIEQVYSNPLLEIDDDNNSATNTEQRQDSSAPNDTAAVDLNADDGNLRQTAVDATDKAVTESELDDTWQTEKSQDLPVDANWDEVYSPNMQVSSGTSESDWEQIYTVTESFQDHLKWQLNLTPFSDRDREIAEAYIDSISPSGFIVGTLLISPLLL